MDAMLRSAVWALRLAWQERPALLAGIAAVSLLRGLVPAGLALSARGIVNGATAGGADLAPLWPWLALGFALTVLEGLGGLAGPLLRLRLRDALTVRVTTDLLAHAATLDLAFFEDPRAQDRLQRARDNPAGHVTSLIGEGISTLSGALQIASLLALVVVIEPWVVALLLLLTGPYLAAQWRLTAAQHTLELGRTARRRWAGYLIGCVTGAATAAEVQLLRLAPVLIERLRTLMAEFAAQDGRLQRRAFGRGAGFVVLTTAAVYGAFAHVAWRVLGGALTVGDLVVFAAASARLRATLEMVVQLASRVAAEALAVGEVRAFFAERPRREAPAAAALPAELRAGLELRAVSFTYPGAAAPAIDDVSLQIAPGETVALVGENGAGKSTLVKLIARLYDPDGGAILLDGIDLRSLPRAAVQQRIACVFQGFGRYEASAADNIAYGDWPRLGHDRAAVEAVARSAGVAPLLAALPHGYDTRLGRQFGDTDLSAGQWQSLAVARAFARDAALLILDEPTASLDARAEQALFERFRALAHGRTTIIVSHRFSTVRMAQRIVVLDGGRVAESGTHAELLARGGPYAALYALHARAWHAPGD